MSKPSKEQQDKIDDCIDRAMAVGMIDYNGKTGKFQATKKAVEYHAPRIERAKEEIRGK
jgi:hypothetical protein